jgi:hypothetical protein
MELSDRKLLELAAKAAGIKGHFVEKCPEAGHPIYSCGISRGAVTPLWNPLTDDGDALRLAVKLGIDIMVDRENGSTCTSFMFGEAGLNTFENWPPEMAATRRAIVRAAAQIGGAIA